MYIYQMLPFGKYSYGNPTVLWDSSGANVDAEGQTQLARSLS